MTDGMVDVTRIYSNMLQRFGNDFNLAMEPDNSYGLDDIQVKIENGDQSILRDIEKLDRLAYGLWIADGLYGYQRSGGKRV